MVMALDHPDSVRSVCLVSSWARADDFFRHQFSVRSDILSHGEPEAYARASALFLFSPRYFREHYEKVRAWCEKSASTVDAEVMRNRIDMILHDQLDRLADIRVPTMVLVGRDDACTPLHLSEELAAAIPEATLTVLEGGHLIYKENPTDFHQAVRSFIGGSRARRSIPPE